MNNITKIEFSPRASGTTTNIRKEIEKMGNKLDNNFLFISNNRSEVNRMMESVEHLFPKGNGQDFRRKFTTYHNIRSVRGTHPKRVFCDNISAENLFKFLSELSYLENIEMYGTIDQYMDDCYNKYAELKENNNDCLKENIKDLKQSYRNETNTLKLKLIYKEKCYNNAVNTIFKIQSYLEEARIENYQLWEQIAKLKKRGDKKWLK